MFNTFLVMAGGAIGAALRYQLGRASLRLIGPGYPWGTLAANVIGGFVMGLAAGWLAMRYQGGQGEQIRLFVAVGVLGGFTTFSAFSLETMVMIERGEVLGAIGYVLLSVLGSVGALALGLALIRGATA
ncbi:MAG: camphor resistance protein CrcB [Sphingobium sp. SCN 64-10]|nr:MAG: camphor resistance protein CrcB [Sphingobium sp. SCN 64-10]